MAKVEQALTTPELAKVVREVEPAAFVVPGRIVRRAIKHDRGLPTLLFRVPHRLVYTIGGETALKVVNRDELGLPEGEPPPETVILIAEPEPDELADRTPAELLREYWRRLFHARVHVDSNAGSPTGRSARPVSASGSGGSSRQRSRRPARSSGRKTISCPLGPIRASTSNSRRST